MSILQLPHARPRIILFDWHATLVDTLDAMYHAVDDVLPHLEELGLLERAAKVNPISTADYPTPAIRPGYSLLDCQGSRAALKLEAQPWRAALRDVLQAIPTNP